MLLFLGFGTIFHNDFVYDINQTYYKAYSEGLFESMIIWSFKPVTVFSTHSTSALVYFALLCLNLRVAGSPLLMPIFKKLFLISGIGYLCLIPFLMSNTSLLVFLAAIPVTGSYLLHEVSPHYRKLFALVFILMLIGISLLVIDNLDIVEKVSNVLSSDGSGFLGRYTAGSSRLQGTYDYLIANYFQPIGLTYSDSIALGDTFIAEYILKISILGYGLILFMFFEWLRWNVLDQRSRIKIFFFFLLADVGYPLLPYYRVIGFLPLFVIIWNNARPSGRVKHV
jgi:hypothetical protein